MNFKIFVITIERSEDRFNIVAKHMNNSGIEFTKFNGIDGKKIKNNEIKKITTKLCFKFCTKSIVGCALSHILLWKHISRENLDYAIILEDDVLFNFNEFLSIKSDLERNLDNFKLILLDGIGINLKKISRFGKFKLVEYDNCYSHSCYMIKRETALQLFNHYMKNKISYHIDFTDNKILNRDFNKIGILEPSLTKNIGMDKSTMTDHNNYIFKYLGSEMYYSLTFPIIKISNIVVNFLTIIVVMILVIFLLLEIKKVWIWLIVSIIFFETLTFI